MSNSVNFPATEINLIGIRRFKKFYIKHLAETLSLLKFGKISGKEASKLVAEKCKGRESYQVFHVIDVHEDGKPIDRRLFRADFTLMRLLQKARRSGQALLYRGSFVIPKEVWKEYKKKYKTANRFEIFKLEKLTQMAQYILVDLDGVKPEDLKRAISYFHRLKIFPEVWQSASGEGNYHVYIKLTGRVERWVEKIKDEKTGEEKKIEQVLYYLPYASDYRVGLVIEGVKEVFRKLGIPYDSVSATRAVWLEGFPNPLKGGRASKKIWEGKVHRLDSLTKKLRPLWEKHIREKAKKEFFPFLQSQRRQCTPVAVGTCEVMEGEHSNPIDYLQANVSFAFRMLDRGYTWAEIERELRAKWNGDEKAFERALKGFRDWVEREYKPRTAEGSKTEGTGAGSKAKPLEKRKHRHYWEYIPAIHEALKEGIKSIRGIAKRTGIPKSSICDILSTVSREQILTSPEEVIAFFKSHQKGGDLLSDEQKEALRKKGKEKWEKYLDEFLAQAIEKIRKKPLSDKDLNGTEVVEEAFELQGVVIALPEPGTGEQGVRIGSDSITPSPRETEGKVQREDGKGGNEKTLSSPSSSSDSGSCSSSFSCSPSSGSGSGSVEGDPQNETLSLGLPSGETPRNEDCFSPPVSGEVFQAVSGDDRDDDGKIRGTLDLKKVIRDKLRDALRTAERSAGIRLSLPEDLRVEVMFLLLQGAGLREVVDTLRKRGYQADGETLKTWALVLEEAVKRLTGNGIGTEENLSGNGKGGKRVFQNKEEAIRYLESLNGRYRVGDRVKLWVVSPTGRKALYEFEKVVVKTYSGFEETGERETWELKTIHWDVEEEDGS